MKVVMKVLLNLVSNEAVFRQEKLEVAPDAPKQTCSSS